MKKASFGLKATLVASLILSGQALAQTLPDEINHPHYEKLYQNLQQILEQKIAEYNKLNNRKQELEKSIAEKERQQRELPARNADLRRMIEEVKAEIIQIDNEINGLENVLARIEDDFRTSNNMLARMQADLNNESNTNRAIQNRRNQVASDVAQLNNRLSREVTEENNAIRRLESLENENRTVITRRNEVNRERVQLTNDVNRFKTEVVRSRTQLNQSNNELNVKKPLLKDAEGKLTPIKAEIRAEEAKIAQIDSTLNPKKSQLNALKNELGRLSPDIARLNNENKTLEQKITTNQTKINSLNVADKIARKNALESEISGVKKQIEANTAREIALQEKMKPVIAKVNELRTKMADAARRGNTAEVNKIRAEMEALNNSIAGDQEEMKRINAETQKLGLSIAPKQNEINTLNTQITSAQNQITSLTNEINSSRAKIAENDQKILQLSQSNAGLSQQIAALQAEVDSLEAQKLPSAQKVANLKSQEAQIQNQVNVLSKDVKELEAQIKRLNADIAQMDKAIADYPINLRRIEANISQLDTKARDLSVQINSQKALVVRIQQSRIAIQRDRDNAQRALDIVNDDLMKSERQIAYIRNLMTEESRKIDSLNRYAQDTRTKQNGLRQSRVVAENDISGATQEIAQNERTLAANNSELPKLRSDLNTVNPQVAAAETARNTADNNARNAKDQFQSRLSLYQNYLTQSQSLGIEKASVGTADGVKAGEVDAKTKANKLASENAALEGKWEALKRGYVRGEIAGFKTGFDIGLASTPDAEKGDADGRVAGARRAKDHANMVIKPEKYLEELERRLKEDETNINKKPQVAKLMIQELSFVKAISVSAQQETVPALSQAEIAESDRIVSSLDAMIAQADIELNEIINLRKSLSLARNVYSTPGAGVNANNVNCSAVYKGVKDFIEACKGAYVMEYNKLYNAAHAETFTKEYGPAFNSQIESVFEAELTRLYANYLKEATAIGREVGVATGKKEIYQQNFNRAENATYAANLPGEISRVENEAVNLVQEHLNQNSALALKGNAKLTTSNEYGIAPGVEADLKMIVKNIGAKDSQGNSIVRIKEVSGNLEASRREAPINSVAAGTHSDLSIMKVSVRDNALPGTTAVIAGEIVHPGNHYRSSRVETFRIETVLGVNPSVESSVNFDTKPNISVLFVTKKHDIDVKVKPKFAGVPSGYEVELQEVGSNYVDIVSKPGSTGVLDRGQEKSVRFTYKLNKSSKGKTLTLKVIIKNEGKVVSEQELQIKPQ